MPLKCAKNILRYQKKKTRDDAIQYARGIQLITSIKGRVLTANTG
jgi:hypothetical protein